MGTSSGTEKLIGALRTYIESNQPGEGRTILSLDATNAFNTASRQGILEGLHETFSELVPFFLQWYGADRDLWFAHKDGMRIIESREGPQQGDALGTTWYAIGLRRPLLRLQERFPDVLIVAFADNIYIGCPEAKVQDIWEAAKVELGVYRQELNPDKCEVWGPTMDPIMRPPTVPAELSFCPEGLLVLGVPFGGYAFKQRSLFALLEKHRPLLAALSTLEDPQSTFLLLRYCCHPRLHHQLRCHDPEAHEVDALAASHDEEIAETARQLLKLPPLTDEQLNQLRLPLSEGGFSLTSTTAIRPAAFVGMGAVVLADVWARHAGAPWMPRGGRQGVQGCEWVRELHRACDTLNHRFPRAAATPGQPQPEPLCLPVRALFTEPCLGLQHKVTREIMAQRYTDLRQRLATPLGHSEVRRAALLESCRGPGALGWLQAVPYNAQLTIAPEVFCLSARLRLGVLDPTYPMPALCHLCHKRSDRYGDHFFKCHYGRERIARHDALTATFYRIFREAKLTGVKKEQLLRGLGIQIQQRHCKQRIDLTATLQDGTPSLFDVTGTHPCHGDKPIDLINLFNRRGGQAIGVAERKKVDRYGAVAKSGGFHFFPLAFETFGRWSKATEDLLHRLAKDVRDAHFRDDETFTGTVVDRWWRLLSVALQRYNYRIVLGKVDPPAERLAASPHPFPADEVWGRGPFHPMGGME